MQAKFAALMSYGLTFKVFEEILPLDQTLAAASIRRTLHRTSERIEADSAQRQAAFVAPRDSIPRPSPVRAIGIDGGYVCAHDEKTPREGWFEVIVGKSLRDEGAGHCFAYVHRLEADPAQRMQRALAISEFFTLDSGEAQAVLSRYGLDMRLGMALQIGFLKMCGRPLDKLQRMPAAVLEHLSPQLGGRSPDIATLRAIYVKRPRTLYQHQQFALDTLGMMRFEVTADAPRVMTALCDEVRAGVERDKLMAQVRVILYERRYVIPAPRTVGELAKRARETVQKWRHTLAAQLDVNAGSALEVLPPGVLELVQALWSRALFEAHRVRADTTTSTADAVEQLYVTIAAMRDHAARLQQREAAVDAKLGELDKRLRQVGSVETERLGWRRDNGGVKDMSCRVALLRMQTDGLISLPPPRNPKPVTYRSYPHIEQAILEPVLIRAESLLCNAYIERHHYLGHQLMPGAQLRYFVRAAGHIIRLGLRGERLEGKTARSEQRQRNLHLVVNNARFLILPWIRCKNLASRILALVSKRLPEDWQARYA